MMMFFLVLYVYDYDWVLDLSVYRVAHHHDCTYIMEKAQLDV